MPIHLNPLSKLPPSASTSHESDAYLLPAIASIQLSAFLTTPLNRQIYNGPPSTHPGIVDFHVARHRKALFEDESYRITSCVGSLEPEVGEEWRVVGMCKYKVVENAAAQGKGKDALSNGVDGAGEDRQGGVGIEVPEGQAKEGHGQQQQQALVWPEGVNVPMIDYLFPRLLAVREQYDKKLGNYLFVETLATDPGWHRMGVGKMLMEEVCQEADRRGWPAWLEGTQEGRRLYEKMGFVAQEEWVLDLGRWDGGVDKGEGWRGEGVKEGEGEGWYTLVIMVRPARRIEE